MFEGITTEERLAAIYNAVPQPPIVHELGGGIYYTCHWLACGETITKWFNYCPKCGQKIDWEAITWIKR